MPRQMRTLVCFLGTYSVKCSGKDFVMTSTQNPLNPRASARLVALYPPSYDSRRKLELCLRKIHWVSKQKWYSTVGANLPELGQASFVAKSSM